MKKIKTLRFVIIGFLLLLSSIPAFSGGKVNSMHIYFDPPYAEIQAKQGEQLSYTVKAFTDMNDEIRYSLEYTEDGMAIDSVTGEFQWVGSKAGWYSVAVKAYLLNHPDEEAYLRMSVMIYNPEQEPCGYIKGNIKFDNGKPYAGAYISIEPASWDSSGFPGYNTFVNTDDSGNYSANLPKGDYYVGVWLNYNDMVWYPDTRDQKQAEVLKIDCGQTLTADFTLKESQFDYIYFMSYPDYTGFLNQQYTYKAEAVSMLNKELRYQLVEGPEGMVIDSITGYLEWTPAEKGNFSAKIKAYTVENPDINAEQEWKITVMDSLKKPCAFIKGSVKDMDGNPMAGAYVWAYSTDSLWLNRMSFTEGFTDNNGNYSINLVDGSYYVVVQGKDFAPVYYDNTQDYNQAKILNVECNNTYYVNFIVDKFKAPEFYSVEGTVTSDKDGSPLDAMVEFMPVDETYGDSIYCPNGYGFEAYTDKNGNYSIQLPDNAKYYAMAVAFSGDYIPEFYNNAKNIADATKLELTGNLTGINFSLSSKPVYDNGLYGFVRDSAGNAVTAAVTAFPYDNQNLPDFSSRSVVTDSSEPGKFTIKNLEPGKYVLFAIPFNRQLAPGFYIDGDFASFEWEKATKIDVPSQGMIDKEHVIMLPSILSFYGGIAVLDGYVYGEVSMAKKEGSVQSSKPLSGVNVIVKDDNGNIYDNTMTDNNGYYKLNNVGVGTRKIVYSKVGYGSYETGLTFDAAENSKQNKNITLLPSGTTGVDDATTNINLNDIEINPQPANDIIELKFASKSGDAEVNLSNIVGGLVMTKQVHLNSGMTSLHIDVSGLQPGTYLITISGGVTVQHAMVQVSR